MSQVANAWLAYSEIIKNNDERMMYSGIYGDRIDKWRVSF
ncbi:hypothetical protein GPLA_1035 [Paraglaciecola polaris LMG 21857]|uniref:Uncharacterized protein n=1 Tax=Paraglaciecola polaris LMG 21857 TaxID=1129793 RepID=K6Z6Y8_9ALTE|nr:hypothetical protein GPLA_1035 [Paraglaciecola polaris LMG 21857]